MVNVSEEAKLEFQKKIVYEYKSLFREVKELKNSFSGNSPPSVFVGSKLAYPKVNVGILSPPEIVDNAWVFDNPNHWVKNNYSIKEILNLRWSLVNSRFRTTVKDTSKFLDAAQEIGIAAKPVELEIKLKKKLNVGMEFDKIRAPNGPVGGLKDIKITENVKVNNFVDKVVSDTDLKAGDAVTYLDKKRFDETTLSKLLSIGMLGIGKNRKLVPTRWSITAVDDTIAKHLLKNIRHYEISDGYKLFYGHYLGNHYLVMIMPYVFSYELFECYLPKSAWNPGTEINVSTDYEDYYGRKNYAQTTAGGYYASRLSLLRYLDKIKQQGTVLVLRFETPEYWAGLGVWVVRKAAERTLQDKFIEFESKEKMIEFVRELVWKKFRFNVDKILKKSRILNDLRVQKRLIEFV